MVSTPESKVKKRIKEHLNVAGVYYYMPVSTGYGRRGAGDFICCIFGFFVKIEAKAGHNAPTKLQELDSKAVQSSGGFAIVVDESNVDGLPAFITELRCKNQYLISILQSLEDSGSSKSSVGS